MLSIGPELNKENILKRVSSYDIFKRYCPNFKELNKNFSDREDDTVPSCRIGLIGDDLLYTDFGKAKSLRAIDYASYRLGLTFGETLRKINSDFNLGLLDPVVFRGSNQTNKSQENKNVNLSNFTNQPFAKKKAIIRIKRREMMLYDLNYWERFGWTLELLNLANIGPISMYWVQSHRNGSYQTPRQFFSMPGQLIYTFDYYFSPEGVFMRKLYFPGDGKNRSTFISNVDNNVVQGYPVLTSPPYQMREDILIVTKALKDCGSFWKLGIPAVATNTETSFFPPEFVEKLKKRFPRIVIWFDNDQAGQENSAKYAEMYGIENTTIPVYIKIKDPSDFYDKKGEKEFTNLIFELLTIKVG